MSNGRGSYVGRTKGQKQDYLNKLRGDGPTSRHALAAPGTESTYKMPPPAERVEQHLTAMPAKPGAVRKFLDDYAIQTIVIALVVSFLEWMAYTLFDLNREIGEMKSNIPDGEKIEVRVRAGLERELTSIRDQVNRLGDRFDRRVDGRAPAP